MSTSAVYQASPVKRSRSTKAGMAARRNLLLEIVRAGRPMTVRQVFYQATVRGIVEKAESGYSKVQTTWWRCAGRVTCPIPGWPIIPAGSASRRRQQRAAGLERHRAVLSQEPVG